MSLFGRATPTGFQYRDDFLSAEEETALLAEIARVEFADFEMRGVVARRRVAFFGGSYDEGATSSPPIPEFLRPLISRVAPWAGVEPDAFAMALINEYPAGAPIGWHRDAPQYDIVAGLSLLSSCRMRFRPYVSPGSGAAAAAHAPAVGRRKTTHEIVLRPRSAYLMAGESRQKYEHSIPPVAAPRYSITFRTLRAGRALRLPRRGGSAARR
jgi:alkylated DNA repair dioxygenase AlkB